MRLDPASAPVRVGVAATLDSEDVLRAQVYRLLARLLAAPPDQALLDVAADLEGRRDGARPGFPERSRAEAARATPAAATEEYFDLFIGIGRGELVPYASYYLTGFLNEKPLARLRGEMAELGIARVAEVKEPEDHIAALCEMMAGLIEGSFGAPAALSAQRRFFERHLAPWAAQFFADLETAQRGDAVRAGRVRSAAPSWRSRRPHLR